MGNFDFVWVGRGTHLCAEYWNLLVPAFEYLRVSDACVGHVRVSAPAAVPAQTRTCTATDCLVVTHRLVPKRHVVHTALQIDSQQ